ncbi:hypothetical protein C8R47DRAFT_1228763 [Mycena vitilis]|nr:hypothetical protein C8R47DRAFT_1228763 [Mycena vitilis]
MDQALFISEIFALICESSQSKQPLSALAQTCRFFQDQALQALWRDMHSIVPLLKCFPDDLWEVSRLDGSPFAFVLIRAIRPEDWTRVRLHAVRIKEIAFDQEDLYLGEHVADSLHLALCGRHPLPQLEKMTWRMGNFPYRHFVSFLGPVGTKISLTLPSGASYLTRLQLLTTRDPPLTEMKIFDYSRHDSDENVESLLVRRLPVHSLRLLETPVFEPCTIDHLASLEDLQSLSLNFCTVSPDRAPPILNTAFPSLRKLKLEALSTEWPAYFTDMLRDCPLAELSLHLGDAHYLGLGPRESRDSYARLNSAIRTHCAAAALDSFHASYPDSSTSTPSPLNMAVCADTLRPLYGFYNLRTVVIYASRFDLTDAELGELATAWPHLMCLDLGSADTPPSTAAEPPRLTLESFAILAERCPALVELGLTFYTQTIPAPTTNQSPQVTLRNLRVHTSRVESPADVAGYIARIFPGIQAIEARSDPNGGELAGDGTTHTSERWMETMKLILKLQAEGI